MKELQITTGCLLLMVAVIGKTSAIYSMSETCEYTPDGFIADPNSCQSYGYCKNNQLVGTGKCPDGYLYNHKLGICDSPANVKCIFDSKNACLNATDNTFVADPTNCNGYCYCSNKKASCTTCPEFQLFDSKNIKCVYAFEKPECTADSICRLVPNAVFVGNPNNCGGYISCLDGKGTEGTCTDGYFNKQLGGCQKTNPCLASSPNPDIGLGVIENLADNNFVCQVNAGNPTEENPIYYPDGQTCMGYYKCTSKNGPGIWGKCPKGLHFNNGKCVTPFTFACTFDRCGNLNREFVGAIDTECKNYLICKNETSQGMAYNYGGYIGLPCTDKNYPFFNEVSGTCEKTSPKSVTYKLCV
ncbi:peritrophin-44 [Lucilia cuprina]|uniref:peritrophin-44 n=1 Tax=Lucilia cuprina TaxID=7375 RepID=UPI001F070F47|nr:peritrophin-44 [Lucilia cuprina]